MDLNECRKEIDLLDKELVKLFCRRLGRAKEAGAAKAARGLPVRDPSREEEKLESVSAMTEEAERPSIRELYSAIFRITRAWEEEQPVPGEKN